MFVRKTYDNDNLLAAQSCCFDLVRISGYESVTWFEFLSDPLELNNLHMTRASVFAFPGFFHDRLHQHSWRSPLGSWFEIFHTDSQTNDGCHEEDVFTRQKQPEIC